MKRDRQPAPIRGAGRGVDELGRPLDLESVLPAAAGMHGHELAPPELALAARDLFPLDLPLHSRLVAEPAPQSAPRSRERVVELFKAEAAKQQDAAVRAALLGEAGRILQQELGRDDAGVRLLKESGSVATRECAEATAELGESLTTTLQQLTRQANDPQLGSGARAAAWIEHGLLCSGRAGDEARALESYRAALAYQPTHPVALALASEAALSLALEDDARKLLTDLLERTQAPQLRSAVLLDLAAITREPAAREALLEQSLAADPEDVTALRRLIAAVHRRDDPVTLAELYRKLAAIAGDPISAGTALLAALTLLDTVDERTADELVKRAPAIAEELKAWIERHPDDASVHAPLAELIRHLERQRVLTRPPEEQLDYIRALARYAPLIEDPREQAVIREQLARLCWRHVRISGPAGEELGAEGKPVSEARVLSDQQRELHATLIENLRYCRRHLPEQRWVCETLATALKETGEHAALVAHLEDWARTQTPGPGRAEVLCLLGDAHEFGAEDLARAAEAYEQAIAEDVHNAAALRALGRTYEKLGRWTQAVETLQRQARETPEGLDRLTALRRVSEIAEHELRDVDLAIETFEEVARLDTGDILALYQLAALCRVHGREARLVTTLELLIERLDDDVARTAALVELGEVLSDKPARAREAYERALQLTPGYTPALQALARLYRAGDNLEPLLRLQHPEVDPFSDPALLSLKAGRICADEIGDVERAILHLKLAYEQNPDLAPARELLTQLYTVSGKIGELYDLLRAQDLPDSPPLTADYHYRLGTTALTLARRKDTREAQAKNFNRALQHFRAALTVQSDHDLAYEQIRRLLVAHHDTANLVRLLEERVTHLAGAEKVSALTELARLHVALDGPRESSRGEREAEGVEKARRSYERAIEVAPEDGLTRREYEVLLRQIDDRRTLPTQRLALARISEDTHYKATLLVESAESLLTSGAAEDREFAASAILGALREDPGNPYAVRQLEGMLSDPNSPLTMTEAVGARAVRAQSDAERAIFYLESAELLEWSGARNEAQRAYRAALRALPSLAPAEHGLQRIATGRQREQTSPKSRAVSVHTLMAEARDAAVRAGSTRDPADAQHALSLLSQILGRDPHYRDAIGLTRALASQLPDPKAALNLLASVFTRVQDSSLRYELGVFLGEHSGRDEEAVHYFKVAADARPEGRQALRGLVRCYQQLGDEESSAGAMERLLALYDPGEPSAVDLRLSLASYLARADATLERALEHTRVVLQARQDDPRALGLMADLLERSGQGEEAAEVLERLIHRERGHDRLHDYHIRRARLLSDVEGRERDALAAVERAAKLNPANRNTILLLTRLLERVGQLDRVSAYLDPIRQAMFTHISRGVVDTGDLRLLAEVAQAQASAPALSRMARVVAHAVEGAQGPPPEEVTAATVGGLQRVLGTAAMRTTLLSEGESADLADLLGCVEAAMDRMHVEFDGFKEAELTPVPGAVDPWILKVPLTEWGPLLGVRDIGLGACATSNIAVIIAEENDATLRLGINLWLRGDHDAWRGLTAVALARLALGGGRIRSLTPIDLDLMLAASFETARVFNAITADPDTRRLRELTALLTKQLSRRQRKALLRICQGLASAHFEPATTARATTMTDLHMALLLSGDIKACLSAACLLDGFAKGSLRERIGLSRLAQDLLLFALSDGYLTLREVALSP